MALDPTSDIRLDLWKSNDRKEMVSVGDPVDLLGHAPLHFLVEPLEIHLDCFHSAHWISDAYSMKLINSNRGYLIN